MNSEVIKVSEVWEWLMTMSDEETLKYAQKAKPKKLSKSFTEKKRHSNIKK